MKSEKLIQLDRQTPPSRDTNQAAHDTIQAQTEAFLAGGGEIQAVTHRECHYYEQPLTRTRRAQIEYAKRHHNNINPTD